MNLTKSQHGGSRKGAGRKATGRGVKVGYSVAPETAAWLKLQKHPGRVIDELVRLFLSGTRKNNTPH
jgi:hypothetical protein